MAKSGITIDAADAKLTYAPNYVEFYSNNAQVGVTGFDVFMLLGEAGPYGKDDFRLQQRARVTLNAGQARLLGTFLLNAAKQYEEHVGPVVLPKMMLQDLDEEPDQEKEPQ